MARIDIPPQESLPEQQRAALSAAESMLGFIANDALIMSRNPALMDAFAALVAAVYKPGHVDAGLKRLIGLVTSAAAGCQYCVAHTAHTSQAHGVSEAKLNEIWSFETSENFSTAERVALRVALHAGQSPNGVTDAMYAELAEEYDDEAQIEIVAVIALFGFLNRWNSTFATDIESVPKADLRKIGAVTTGRH